MRLVWHLAGLIGAMALALLPLALPARAASTPWYAGSGSTPSANLTPSAPRAVDLPNYDPGRDAEPGLLLTRTSRGANETNPSKYQQWSRNVSGMTLSIHGFRIWAAPEGFVKGKTVELHAYLMACGNGCDVLDAATASVRASPEWRKVNFSLIANNVTFDEDEVLVVRVVAHTNSDVNAWLAYGTATYDASLQVDVMANAPTTTTSTRPPTTTTTAAAAGTSATSSTSSTSTTSTPTTTSPREPTQALPSGDDSGSPEAAGPSLPGDRTTGQESTFFEPTRFMSPSGNTGTSTEEEIDIFRSTVRELEPAQGLAVAFATVTENIALYWQAAIGTGGVASILLWLGLSHRENNEGIGPRLDLLD